MSFAFKLFFIQPVSFQTHSRLVFGMI